jgi:hypothetical protein
MVLFGGQSMETGKYHLKGKYSMTFLRYTYPQEVPGWPTQREILLRSMAAENGYDFPLYLPFFIPFTF